jgi:glycosyltransferase involved in cell wall biosynthesis
MTAFNREKYISEAIESVISQTYQHFELIILDDSSSDKTYSIACKYSLQDPRLKVFKNDVNIGQFANRNKIVNFANHDLLVYLDSDDTLSQNALEYIIDCFLKYPNVSFATICYDNEISPLAILGPADIINHHFFKKSILHIGPSGTVIKKELFQKINGFPVIYGPAGDAFYNIKAASNSSVICMSYNYLNYRRHDGQEINNSLAYLHNGYRYFNDVLNIHEIPLLESQKKYLKLKNKRRFFVNSLKYLIKYKDLKKFRSAYSLAGFTGKDIFKAIFQW